MGLFGPKEKLSIRLPSDDDPNPYDSKTDPKTLGPRWLWDWTWWVAIIAAAIVLLVIRNR